jgi:hypothetical protein
MCFLDKQRDRRSTMKTSVTRRKGSLRKEKEEEENNLKG